MSKDPKPLAKPYLAGNLPYLTLYRIQTWEDGEPSGNDSTEYSELQKPYAYDEDEPEDYAFWEWTWPKPQWPIIPPVTWPDPITDPCAIDDSCTFIKISGPGTMKCGDSVPYTALWVTLGCGMPPGWAIFSKWSLSGGDGECELDAGLVIARVKCSSVASSQTLTLTVQGPFGCTDSIQIIVSCDECCQEFTLTGNDTVNQSGTWTGTINPACPSAECEVTGAECELTCGVNQAGSQVTVTVGADDCGSFAVTVTDPHQGGECEPNLASKGVRINAGIWVSQGICCTGSGSTCNPGDHARASIIAGDQRWGGNPGNCSGNWYSICRGLGCDCDCPTCNGWPPGGAGGTCPRGACGSQTFPCAGTCYHCHWICDGGC